MSEARRPVALRGLAFTGVAWIPYEVFDFDFGGYCQKGDFPPIYDLSPF